MNLSLVIPFYNEEGNVRRVVSELTATLEGAYIDYELVLVNNGSIDDTPQIVNQLVRDKSSRIKAVHVSVNEGYGWGIINGLRQASGEFVGYMGGDGQIKSEDVVRVFNLLKDKNYNLVKVKRTVRKDGPIRRIISGVFNLLFLVMFNVRTLDVNGNPKILKRELMGKIDPECKDWFIDAELMIKAKYLGLRVGEVPVEFLSRKKGRSHVEFTTILDFLRNMWNYKFGRGLTEWKQNVLKS